jgi:hypothetical protein
MSEKRCRYCGGNYEPYARAVQRQKHCGAPACRRKHKRARDRAWRSQDTEWRKSRQAKVRQWASGASTGSAGGQSIPSIAVAKRFG